MLTAANPNKKLVKRETKIRDQTRDISVSNMNMNKSQGVYKYIQGNKWKHDPMVLDL